MRPLATTQPGGYTGAMIRVAVCGAGHWGPNLVRNFDNKITSEVTWVIERDKARLAQLEHRFPGIRGAQDLEPVLRDERVDAVVTPPPLGARSRAERSPTTAALPGSSPSVPAQASASWRRKRNSSSNSTGPAFARRMVSIRSSRSRTLRASSMPRH